MSHTVDLRKKPADESPPLEPTPVQEEVKADTIRWRAEFSSGPSKNNAIQIATGLVVGAAAILFFGLGYLFAVLLIVAGTLLVITSFRKPETHEISVDAGGITIQDRRYFYSQIKSFWINYNPPHENELLVLFRKPYVPMLRLPIGDADPLEIRKIMVPLVPEQEHEDSLLDQIVKRLIQ